VTRAIRKHLGDFLAIIALFVIAMGIAAFILHNQRLRFPVVQQKPFILKAELPNAQAVTPGQGQTVRVAGVEVGEIGKVTLERGRAVVELALKHKYEGLIRSDASALLRTKTGLKDMFIEVDPGAGRPLKEGQRIPVSETQPDINPDEILSALDSDTRNYLRLLISGAGKGLRGRGSDLRETLARLGPLHRDLKRVSEAIARRRANLRRLIHNYGLLTTELGKHDREIVTLVRASNATLSAFASEDTNISRAVSKLPGALRQTSSTLTKVDRLGQVLGPAAESLRPAFRELDDANREVLPLAREGAPIIRREIRPFARISQPFTRDLGRAAKGLNAAAPDLTTSFHELNRLFNIGAYNPNGTEGLSGNLDQDRARNEGYLYWLAWVAQNTVNLFNVQDAHGPLRRATAGGVPCSSLSTIGGEAGAPPELTDFLGGLFGGIGACTP
jgi:phospholipid/cholesterol/gamma-HCH transport system substrate-binding protein